MATGSGVFAMDVKGLLLRSDGVEVRRCGRRRRAVTLAMSLSAHTGDVWWAVDVLRGVAYAYEGGRRTRQARWVVSNRAV
jgi:hypothetical protein